MINNYLVCIIYHMSMELDNRIDYYIQKAALNRIQAIIHKRLNKHISFKEMKIQEEIDYFIQKAALNRIQAIIHKHFHIAFKDIKV